MTERWLVIDDSSTIQRVIKLAFQDYDVQIAEADSCVDGSRELTKQSPSLIIIDASVAGAQGVQDFVALRNMTPKTPFVILQGSYDAIEEASFLQVGFQHFLRKPFDGAQLLQVTRQALGRALPSRIVDEAPVPPPPPAPEKARPAREETKSQRGLDLGLASEKVTRFGGAHTAPTPSPAPIPEARPPSKSWEDSVSPAVEAFAQSRRELGSRGLANAAGPSGLIEPMLRDDLEKAVKQAVEEYCRKNFANLAREMIGKELERLTQERSRLLVDK
jgi:CheY-like chemotaxis protein